MALTRSKKWFAGLAAILVAPFAIGLLVLAFALAWAYPGLPSIDALTDYQPK